MLNLFTLYLKGNSIDENGTYFSHHGDRALIMQRANLTRYAWLSLAAALITLALKFGAYWLTNSVGLLSDAIESLVNLVSAG